jgi:chaperonin cofactor prefoldin
VREFFLLLPLSFLCTPLDLSESFFPLYFTRVRPRSQVGKMSKDGDSPLSLPTITPHYDSTTNLNMSSRLVLETLDSVDPDRKCFRMINGVLIERTVLNVKPALQTNLDGLKKVLEDLLKQYKTKQEEMEKWKVRSYLAHSTRLPQP